MSGISFFRQLRGEPFEPRQYIFAERGPHVVDGTMSPRVSAASFDLARCVRSDRFKLIYNCTPHGAVKPVDSAGQPYWIEMEAAHTAGKLSPELVKTYFSLPRPTYELYDLENDPGELNNLAGKPAFKEIEHDLKRALAENMVLNWDFLPTPLR